MNKSALLTIMALTLPVSSFAQYSYGGYASAGYGVTGYGAAGLGANNYGYANTNLQGSGYWGGQQNCGYQQSQNTGRGQGQGQGQGTQKSEAETSANSRITELKKQLTSKQSEKKRAEQEMEIAARKLERQFDGEILDFLLETHIEKGNTCNDYITAPGCASTAGTGATAVGTGTASVDPSTGATTVAPGSAAVATVDCAAKDEVPEKLKANWNSKYCAAKSKSDGGKINSSICADRTLKSEERKSSSYSASECGKQFSDYRKNRIKRDDAQAKIERIEDEIQDQQYAIADAKERADLEKQYGQSKTEADCEECAAMGRGGSGGSGSGPGGRTSSGRDWTSILGNIGVGLGLAYIGKQYDDRNAEYSAQLGYPPQSGYPTAVSLGAPFILNGVYGAVNGSNGQGSFGCGNSMSMGGNLYGQNGANGYGSVNGAFGYPQNMLGNQINGGGMYSMGYNPYNSMYGNTNPYASLYGNTGYGNMTGTMTNGYGTYMNGYGNMQNAYGTMQNGSLINGSIGYMNNGYGNYMNNGYGTMTNYGLGNMTNSSQNQLASLQYQQQMAQYQMQQYQQQYQQQMQYYQQQQQVATQSGQIQQEIYNLQLRLQNLNSGYYTYGSTNGSGSGGYYGSYYSTGSTTAPTWIPGTTSTIYTTPTTYPTTTYGR